VTKDNLRQPREWQNWWNGIHSVPEIQNPRRRTLVAILNKRPGLNIYELAALLSVTRTAAKYHLRRLEREHMIVKVRRGHHQLFFPMNMSERRRTAIVLLRIGAVRLVAEEFFRDPRQQLVQVARRINISTRQVRRIVRQLNKAHLLEVAPGEGRSHHIVHMHPELRLLIAHSRGPLDPQDVEPRPAAPAWVPGVLVTVAQHLSHLQ
jgi:predicted transcriptional regulator